MADDLTPEEQDYSSRLFLLLLDQTIGMDSANEDGSAGLVRPDIIRSVLVDVAATIDFNAGLGRVPSERRKTGELLGKRYAGFLGDLIANEDKTGWTPAVRVEPDTIN